MFRRRRASDYSLRTHLVEQLLTKLSGDGWMARLAHRHGWQTPVQVVQIELALSSYPASAPPLRIAFAADFHAGPVTHPAVISQACDAIAALRPDVLVLGGDYVSLENRYVDVVLKQVRRTPAPFGRFAVLGNHDLWADDYPIMRGLQQAGFEVLLNANKQLSPPFENVWICGFDDPTAGRPDALQTFAGADGTRIVAMHSPEGLEQLQDVAFAVALCGHTHGGQIAWPSGKPIWLPPGRWSRRYPAGQFSLDQSSGRMLVVSRGVGYGALPIRCFAPSDVVLCTIGHQPQA